MDEKALLEAIRAIVQEENKPITARLDAMQGDIDQIKEDTTITRDSVNGLGEWAEVAADVLRIKYPLAK